jgi:enoyl-CoA hydratase/carnithine racemase
MDGFSLTIDGPLARLSLNRPERRNVVTRDMWRALPELCRRIEALPEALVVIVEGEGAHFSAGADITEFEAAYHDEETTRAYLQSIQEALSALCALGRPTIAALRGNSIGGGLALGLSCDLRFCAADALIAITPAKLGLLYGFVETRRLVDLVGPARAKDILFTGRRLDAAEALAIGLVDRTVPTDRLNEAVTSYAMELARLSQYSIRGSKLAVDAIARGMIKETPAFRALIEDAARRPDSVEGRNAFTAKRPPHFTFRGRLDPVD